MANTKTISVRNVPADLWQALRLESFKTGKSLPELLADAIRLFLKRSRQ